MIKYGNMHILLAQQTILTVGSCNTPVKYVHFFILFALQTLIVLVESLMLNNVAILRIVQLLVYHYRNNQ